MAEEPREDLAERIEASVRKEIASLLLAEFQYWLDSADERGTQIAIGGMGAASNLLAAVLMKTKLAVYKTQIDARGGY